MNKYFSQRDKPYFESSHTVKSNQKDETNSYKPNSFNPSCDEYRKSKVTVVKKKYVLKSD